MVKTNDHIFAEDMIDWSNEIYPRVGDVVSGKGSRLLDWGVYLPAYGIVTGHGMVYAASTQVPMPTWIVMWSPGSKMGEQLREFTADWIESGHVKRLTCKSDKTGV